MNIVVSNFIYLSIFFIVCRHILKSKHKDVFQWIGILVSCVIISMFNVNGPSMVSVFVYLLIFIVYGYIFFEESLVKAILIGLLYFVITMVSELISSFLVDLIVDLNTKDEFYVFKYSIALVISLLICYLLSKEVITMVSNQFEDDYVPKYVFLIFVLPILTIFLFGNIREYFYLYSDYKIYVLILFGLLLSNFITIYIFLLSIKSMKWKQKLELSEKEKELLNEKIDLINHNYDNSFNFLHDLLHKCNRLNGLINENNIDELKKEIQNLYANCFKKYNMMISNSNALNKVINLYSSELIENNITFRSTMEDVEYSNIDNTNIISLLTLLLSNAIESCKLVKGERVIILRSKKSGNSKILQIKFTSSVEYLIEPYDEKLKELFKKYNIKYNLYFDKEQDMLDLLVLF